MARREYNGLCDGAVPRAGNPEAMLLRSQFPQRTQLLADCACQSQPQFELELNPRLRHIRIGSAEPYG